ncbi:MAG: ABC transporter ATP-binding protein [bacterium]|nr:ABC transporter ATP-binding protein [bacterium]
MLEVKHLRKQFGGIRAVDDCSFSIRVGALTALIGPNGAGKTTVVNIISGLERPDEGAVSFFADDITTLTADQRAKRGIVRTFQQVRLFRNLSVRDNLALAVLDGDDFWWKQFTHPATVSDDVLTHALERVGLAIALDALPTALSFGQRKLLELARALLRPHKLMLLDEPVAGVTPVLRRQIAEILEQLRMEGETILFIEHDMDFVMRIADEVIVMEEGRVLTKGTPDEVRRDPAVLEAYLGEQV